MNTHRNPILLGQVETIDLLLPEVRTMLQRQGIYLASDSARPGFTVPLVVNADGLWSLQLDSQLNPERFNRTVQIAGPFYAPGEEVRPVDGTQPASPPLDAQPSADVIERVAGILYEEENDEPWLIAGVEHPLDCRGYYRELAERVCTAVLAGSVEVQS
ncbi:hypothetical protein D3C71_1098700 [compost metagenome]